MTGNLMGNFPGKGQFSHFPTFPLSEGGGKGKGKRKREFWREGKNDCEAGQP